MLKLEIILAENDVMNISEGLKEIGIGGLTVIKVRGRGAKTAAEIHSSKGMEIFVPHFSDKYRLMVVIPESKEEIERFNAALRRKQLSLILAGKMDPSEASELKRLFK